MRLRNSFRILINNFVNVYKLLFFRFVTGVLFFSIAFVIIEVGLREIFGSEQITDIAHLAGEFFRALFSGNIEFLESFHEVFTASIADFLYLLGENLGSIIGAVIGVCAIYLLFRILNGTANFAVGSIIDDKMESYSRTKFSSAYFRNLSKALRHQLLYVPLSFIYDVLSLLACWFFFFYMPSFLSTWGVFTVFLGLALSMTGFICLQALKMTALSAWIPCIVTGKEGVLEAFSSSFHNNSSFGGRFSTYLIAIYLIFAANVLLGVCTFGSILFITVPASFVMLLCIQFVFYYEDINKKYFISFQNISGSEEKPESMGDQK